MMPDTTITIAFEDGETVMRALGEYRDKQIESAGEIAWKQPRLATGLRQAAADTERLMKAIEAQL